MKTVEFSDDEIRVLIGMIDVAVRARGIEAAGSAVHLVAKLQKAAEPVEECAEE